MELSIDSEDENSFASAMEKLKKLELKIIQTDEKLIIVSRNMITKVHEIYRIFESENIQITELKMRENTLEDVFIHLTGRRLRQ